MTDAIAKHLAALQALAQGNAQIKATCEALAAALAVDAPAPAPVADPALEKRLALLDALEGEVAKVTQDRDAWQKRAEADADAVHDAEKRADALAHALMGAVAQLRRIEKPDEAITSALAAADLALDL